MLRLGVGTTATAARERASRVHTIPFHMMAPTMSASPSAMSIVAIHHAAPLPSVQVV